MRSFLHARSSTAQSFSPTPKLVPVGKSSATYSSSLIVKRILLALTPVQQRRQFTTNTPISRIGRSTRGAHQQQTASIQEDRGGVFDFVSRRANNTMSASEPKSMYTWDRPNHLEEALPSEVRRIHDDAVGVGANTYIDPDTGYTVFCRKAHLERGKCCGSGCRHCPYGWANVPPHRMPKPKPASTTSASPAVETNIPKVCVADVEELVVVKTTSSPSQAPKASDPPGKSRVYTRTGDKGTSSLFTGERRKKTDGVFETLGTVDELSSCIGMAKEYLRLQQSEGARPINILTGPKANQIVSSHKDTEGDDGEGSITAEQMAQIVSVESLEHIQQLLMDIGSIVATPTKSERCPERAKEKVSMYEPAEWVKDLEKQIDLSDSFLPPIRVFILPGGGLASAHLHLARSVCRRAERCMLVVLEEHADEYCDLLPQACRFINRLSDFLFVAARAAALHADVLRSAPNGGRVSE